VKEPSIAHPPADVYAAIADGSPRPWEAGDDGRWSARELGSLQLLADVSQAFRSHSGTARAAGVEPAFRWGGLDVFEEIGRGSYGVVYRAFDPWLAREVALKLYERDAAGSGGALDEARRLARLRHRNVLLIHGCAVHDERAGLWSELIRGQTLRSALESEGAFSIEESLRIARDLASALAAIHAQGLVHGDVKPDNVMREQGARIVLMDFGAGGDERLLAGRRLISGTLRYLPPEVLDGAPVSMASDVYALGVLIYQMLAGRPPFADLPLAELRAAKQQPVAGLLGLRQDLPAALALLVQSMMAPDPAQRPRDADAVLQALAKIAADRPVQGQSMQHPLPGEIDARAMVAKPATPAAWMRRGLLIAAIAAVTVVTIWLLRAPLWVWHAEAQFLRIEDSGEGVIGSADPVHVGDRIYLRLHSNRASHVYVLNEDADGVATVLFPTVHDRNPLPAGQGLRLPGGVDSTLAWQVTSGSQHEEFVLIAALQPLDALESALAEWSQAREAEATRSTSTIVDIAPATISGPHLRAALAEAGRRGDDAVRIWQWRFAHSP
jgi:eukaryotic-like serine/threonine-protein kinase